MKKVFLSIALFVSAIFTVNAQTADEVIAKYITEIGGAEKWAKVQSIKIEGQIEVQGIQIPFTLLGAQMKGLRLDAEFQGKGIGKKMIAFAEQWASDNNYTYMHCNARKTAVPFYLQSKYIIVGDTFLEVNIPHLYMYKKLS